MSAEREFRRRLNEVSTLLQSAIDIQAQQATATVPSRETARMLASAKAASFIMIYNAVEFAVREFVVGIRQDIENEQVLLRDLSPFWKRDVLKYLFADRLKQGMQHTNFLDEVGDKSFEFCKWDKEEHRRKLPFAGNINKRRLFEFIKQLDLPFTAPQGTLGGDDLENIWTRRNALSHGDESFEEAGEDASAEVSLQVVGRIEVFIVALIASLDAYRAGRRFMA